MVGWGKLIYDLFDFGMTITTLPHDYIVWCCDNKSNITIIDKPHEGSHTANYSKVCNRKNNMDFIIIIVFSTIISLIMIFIGRKKTWQDVTIRILGGIVLLMLIFNTKSIGRFFYQVYFLDQNNVVKIQIKPNKNYYCYKTIEQEILISDINTINSITNILTNNLKPKNVKQPNCSKSFLLSLFDSNGKVYIYEISQTSNNGTLIDVYYNNMSMGAFNCDGLMDSLYEVTNINFFKVK